MGIQKQKLFFWMCLFVDVQLALLPRKTYKVFFFCYVEFSKGVLGISNNNQTLFDFSPRILKHIMIYHNHSTPYAGFRLLKIFVFELNMKTYARSIIFRLKTLRDSITTALLNTERE